MPNELELVHQLFEQAAGQDPGRVAVVAGPRSVSYGELEGRANQIAHHLRAVGIRPDQLVGVHLERGIEVVSVLLGVLKAGAAYVPLDPAFPLERLSVILQAASPAVVISQPELLGGVSELSRGLRVSPEVVAIDDDWYRDCGWGTDALAPAAIGQNLVYVIFTSGSTGAPKGVALTHAGLRNLLDYYGAEFEPGLVCLHFNSFSFDASFTDLFGALSSGGTAVMASEAERRDLVALLQLVDKHGIERMNLPTPVFSQAMTSMGERFVSALGSVRELWVSGDRLRLQPAAARALVGVAGLRVNNQYGPTETHVCTDHTVDLTAAASAGVQVEPPIGRGLHNCDVFVLDDGLQPVADGEAGELCVGGVALARGYIGQPALTAERFLPNPYGPAGSRLYRTGDLVRCNSTGALEFLGRVDDQVKVRGYRVEPREIELKLLAFPGVNEVAVVARDVAGDVRLAAYLVINRGRCDLASLRSYLAARLPDYMVPSWFVVLDELPLTATGKVDRAALPAPGGDRNTELGELVAPRSETEEMLAGIWCEVLGVDEVSANDNFFDLGGHSLLAIAVAERIHSVSGREIPTAEVMNAPSLAQLAVLLSASAGGAS